MLPPGNYELTLDELRACSLVTGNGVGSSTWNSAWRASLVENLAVLVGQLHRIGIVDIFADGSFVEDKDHPNDIDGYFVCDLRKFASGDLQRELNLLDPHKVWTWDPRERRPFRGYPKKQLPMWHQYRVELYPTTDSHPESATRSGTNSSSLLLFVCRDGMESQGESSRSEDRHDSQ